MSQSAAGGIHGFLRIAAQLRSPDVNDEGAGDAPATGMQQALFDSGTMHLVQARHGAFIVNRNDAIVGRSLETYGEWCEGEIDTLLQMVEPGDIVIDVGANIGTHTVPLARKVGTQGGVLAIEPQRLVHQALCGNVALNGLTSVVCIIAAAGAEKGRTLVPLFDPDQELNWAGVKASGHAEGEVTEVVALDDLAFERCKLIKIDTSGMEAEVLKGARDLIARCQPILFVTANNAEGDPELLGLLDDLGYRGWWHVTRYFQPDNFNARTDDIFQAYRPDANLICFPAAAQVEINGFEPVTGRDDSWVKAMQRIVDRADSGKANGAGVAAE